MAPKNTNSSNDVTISLRFERQVGATEKRPDYYEAVTISLEEAEAMIAADLRERQAAADDPSTVEPRSIELIIREELNKVEYNGAKKWHRHTGYVSFDADDPADDEGQPRSRGVQAASQRHGGVYLSATAEDPTDEWATAIAIRTGLSTLSEREREVIELLYFEGCTQREAADLLDVSQPMVAKVAKRALSKLREFFSDEEGVIR